MRYTTFGRHFTKISKLTEVCTGHPPHLNFGLKNGKMVSHIQYSSHSQGHDFWDMVFAGCG
jgi:hypothetical protein